MPSAGNLFELKVLAEDPMNLCVLKAQDLCPQM
jgi:hypothetical protein